MSDDGLKLCACGCGVKFEPVTEWQKYASALCRWRDWAKKHPRVKVASHG